MPGNKFYLPLCPERWQSGRMRLSWKQLCWEAPGVRIPLSPLNPLLSKGIKWTPQRGKTSFFGVFSLNPPQTSIIIPTKPHLPQSVNSPYILSVTKSPTASDFKKIITTFVRGSCWNDRYLHLNVSLHRLLTYKSKTFTSRLPMQTESQTTIAIYTYIEVFTNSK